jgi:hypothetical protein
LSLKWPHIQFETLLIDRRPYQAITKSAQQGDIPMARPDQWISHYNMGNYYLNRGELKKAIASYDKSWLWIFKLCCVV